MTPGKRLTIGVTVNLERYENLRVAVEGDVETIEDAENLARYLDNVLAGFGKNDPETEKQISNYRFRVLPGRGDAANATEAGVLQEEVPRFDADLVSDAVTAVTPASDIQKAEEADTGACTPSALAKEMSGPVCADCGTPITKQEDKLGRLFVDRPLCKSCLEALQKAQQH
ncbi:hypothetical protein [Methanogenium organophilum]|uniref:Uncharacterized protein n=1 Tax=Methanogenium organophilum TaxID=2199 RepID=A0A9X9T7P4_METOG|nr:hypothetical protein [Methanogenium organophilum]WAI00611.1 hypothetical protein OU421_09255 [Methanogenium organophilum]